MTEVPSKHVSENEKLSQIILEYFYFICLFVASTVAAEL